MAKKLKTESLNEKSWLIILGTDPGSKKGGATRRKEGCTLPKKEEQKTYGKFTAIW